MKNKFGLSIVIQILIVVLYAIHRFAKPLGSNFMFAALLVSIVNGIFLLWYAFKKDGLTGWQKWVAIVLATMPLLFLFVFGLYISAN